MMHRFDLLEFFCGSGALIFVGGCSFLMRCLMDDTLGSRKSRRYSICITIIYFGYGLGNFLTLREQVVDIVHDVFFIGLEGIGDF